MKEILELLPINQQLEALKNRDNNHWYVLDCVATIPDSLQMVLEVYPEEERLEAVTKTRLDGLSVLHRVLNNPSSLVTILKLLPQNSRLEALKKPDQDGEMVLHVAAKNPQLLRAILISYPEIDLFNVTNERGYTVTEAIKQCIHDLKHSEDIQEHKIYDLTLILIYNAINILVNHHQNIEKKYSGLKEIIEYHQECIDDIRKNQHNYHSEGNLEKLLNDNNKAIQKTKMRLAALQNHPIFEEFQKTFHVIDTLLTIDYEKHHVNVQNSFFKTAHCEPLAESEKQLYKR